MTTVWLRVAVVAGVWAAGGGLAAERAWAACPTWMAGPEARALRNPVAPSEDSFKKAQGIFGEYCVMCHGPHGRGDGSIAASLPRRPANLTDKGCLTRRSDGELFWRISHGDDVMPSFETAFGLSAEDRWHLVNFVRRLAK